MRHQPVALVPDSSLSFRCNPYRRRTAALSGFEPRCGDHGHSRKTTRIVNVSSLFETGSGERLPQQWRVEAMILSFPPKTWCHLLQALDGDPRAHGSVM